MDWTAILSQLPISVFIILLVLLIFLIVIVIRSGREFSFWPPKIGAKVETTRLQEQLKVNEERLQLLRDENESLRKIVTDTTSENTKLKSDLAELREEARSQANDIRLFHSEDVAEIVTLFDRMSMRVPTHDEDFGMMLRSLHELRIQLQQHGSSTIKNRYLNTMFGAIQNDLSTIESMIRVFVRSDLKSAVTIVDPIMSQRVMQEIAQDAGDFRESPFGVPLNYGARHGAQLKIEDTRRMIESMTYRNWSRDSAKSVTQEQMVSALTFSWLLGAIDALRASILSQVNVLKFF